MQFNRSRSWLVGLAVLIAAATSSAQAQQVFQPFGPIDAGSLSGMQIFAPPELDPLDGFIKPATGPYFQYERFYWSIHQPNRAPVGFEAPGGPGSPEDTSFMHDGFDWGNRFELGYMQDCNSGWMVTVLKTNTQFNSLETLNPVVIPFETAAGGTTDYHADRYFAHNFTRLAGIELNKTFRYEQEHNGGNWELYVGARFLQFHDRFDVNAPQIDPLTGLVVVPNVWDAGIDNDIVGPEIGAHWFRQNEHWIFSAEFRFLAGANFENVSEYGTLLFPPNNLANASDFFHKQNSIEFAPTGELRLETSYQVFKNVSICAGYTALGGTGVSRASQRIEYTLPTLGIINGYKQESWFVNGVSFGFQVNR